METVAPLPLPMAAASGPARELPAWALRALLFFLVLLVYLPALRGGFLWNDSDYVTRADLQSSHGLVRIWFEVGATEQYYPLLHSAFWVEHALWGDAALGYHLANLLLHAANACLLYTLLRRMALPGAALAAALFALHPVAVESVAWISEEKNTLSTLFCLLAAGRYLLFEKSRSGRDYALGLGLFVCALLTKSVTATLPGALLVLAWWRRGALNWRQDVWPLLPWFGLGAAAGLFTGWVERTYIGASGSDFALSLGQRFLLAPRIAWFYLGKLAWPFRLTFIYPHWTIDPGSPGAYLPLLFLLGLAAALWVGRDRTRGAWALLLLFLGTLFPVAGFFNVYAFRFSYVADHWNYLPGLVLLAGAGSAGTLAIRRWHRRSAPFLGAALLTGAAVLVWRQASIYRDSRTLWTTTLARNPQAWIAHNNWGAELQGEGRWEEALAEFTAAIALKPDLAAAHHNRGDVLFALGRFPEALAEQDRALALSPEDPASTNSRGVALVPLGRAAEARAAFEEAIRRQPGLAAAHANLGDRFFAEGRWGEAIHQYEQAGGGRGISAEIERQMGEAYTSLGRPVEAEEHFVRAWRLRPADRKIAIRLAQAWARQERYPEALRLLEELVHREEADPVGHYEWANVLYYSGQAKAAILQYEQALALQPDYLDARSNLASLYYQEGRMPEALAHFREIVRRRPESAPAHNNLASALVRSGFTAEARAHYETAIRLDPTDTSFHSNLAALERQLGERGAAMAEYEEILRRRPGDPEARKNLEEMGAGPAPAH